MSGYQLTQNQMKWIREVVRHYRQQILGEVRNMTRVQQQQDRYAKLKGDLGAAVEANFDTNAAPSVTVDVWESDGAGGLRDAGYDVTVINRSDISYTSGTHGIIRWIAGEWVFFGNCNPWT